MVAIHDWQPVTISPELAREWLNPATPKERTEQIMLLHWEPTEAFEWLKVDLPVGNIRNQPNSVINPISDPFV
jgi:putative SOS response-associated peptidase YedK